MQTKRTAAGSYTVSHREWVCNVIYNGELRGPDKWSAYANWDRHLYTDPLPTKRAAAAEARRMIGRAIDRELTRLVEDNSRRLAALGL